MHDWREIILKQTDTMQKAIEVLNVESLQIALVVNEIEQLVGTITDGDIRRGLIKHYGLDTPVTEFMFTTPILASTDETREEILDKMNKAEILQIPIVDKNSQVVGLKTLQHLLEKRRFDNPVFLMAGGFGKRLQPLTDDTPKPLLTVGNKPILETILDQFMEAGFHDFYISTHYKAEMVRDYFGDGSDLDVSIKYIHEDKPLGTAGALGLLPKDLPDMPILMMNGDLLTKVDFPELLRFHNENGGEATMCVREYDFQVPYGVIKANAHKVESIVEKPVHKFFVNAGIYVLSSEIINKVDGNSYLDMPHMLQEQIDLAGQINMFPMHEYWLDIGQIEQFEQAQLDSKTYFHDQ
jgi:dTDP-glucose pyrophosphorylase